MTRFLVRDAEDSDVGSSMSYTLLNDIQSNAFADDVDIVWPRMRWWSPAIAEAFFASGGVTLPSHWQPACLTSVSENEDGEARQEGAAAEESQREDARGAQPQLAARRMRCRALLRERVLCRRHGVNGSVAARPLPDGGH